MIKKVRTSLWFAQDGEEAARFYVSLLADQAIENLFYPAPNLPPQVIDFTLGGSPYMILNAGPKFTHSEAASIHVATRDQAC